jgi:hypothetical protein
MTLHGTLATAVALALLMPGTAPAQRAGDVPARPDLSAAADTNDARAYYELGVQNINARNPREAADAFYWAMQIDPAWSAPLYGRYAALLMSNPRRLVDYWEGNRRVVRTAEVMAIDSLYFRALTIDPFLYRRFEKDLLRLYLNTVVVERSRNRAAIDRAELDFLVNRYLRQEAGPYTRGVMAYGEGRFVETLRLWDQSLRRSTRKAFIRTERGRLFAHVGNDAAALEEFGHALEEMRGREERNLVHLYESKALLEHARAVLHERMGNLPAAHEAFGRALQEDLSFSPAHAHLAVLSLEAGDTTAALGLFALAVETKGASAHTRALYATVLLATGDDRTALEQAEAAIGDSPYYAAPYLLRADVYERRGDAGATRASLAEYLARAPRGDPRRPAAQRRYDDLAARVSAAGTPTEGGR